jgi:hypothetical protein
MSVKFRQDLERKIAEKLIDDAIGQGFQISVDDGEEVVLEQSADKKDILAAMFSVDEEYLWFYKNGLQNGWVFFVYGNDGWDAISDYTANLEDVLRGVIGLSDELCEYYGD